MKIVERYAVAFGIALSTLVGYWVGTAVHKNEPSHDISLSKNIEDTDPACLRMYHYIELYADSFQIPRQYAYGIAYAETRYKGPLHWQYNHQQTSPSGAVGPMQIMLATARGINKDNVSINRLRTDIEYNVMTSMKLLRRLHDKNQDWLLAFGQYNTGKPCVNAYARKVYNYKGPQYDSSAEIVHTAGFH